jgi:WXG100 family type VII secretion target
MPDFSVNYAASHQASEGLAGATRDVAKEIEDLHTAVNKVMSELEGAMAAQYHSKHGEWLAKVDEMRGILHSGHQTLNVIHGNYATTDTSEGARWDGLTVG